jgi:flagellar biogenesis protein FliO
VEVGDTWLVVGVGASSVNLVHTMPKPAGATVATPPEHAFSRLIGQALKSRSPGT